MARDLAALQERLFEAWLEESTPDDWHAIDATLEGKKAEVALELDADLLAWFRRRFADVGPVFNLILRAYWRAVVCGQVRTHWQPEVYAPARERYLGALVRRQMRRLADAGFGKEMLEELGAAVAEMENAHRKADPLLRMWDAPQSGEGDAPPESRGGEAEPGPAPEPAKGPARKGKGRSPGKKG